MFWLVCYDVVDDKRRHKVSETLLGYGRRVQYSVFECHLASDKIDQLMSRLSRLIDEHEDDLRAYPLSKAEIEKVRLLGRAELTRNDPYNII